MDAVNIPDSPRASARMSNQALSLLIQREVGIEAILHYTCRDRNVLCIQSDLLGAAAVGIKNLICITGDPPKMGNYPDATAVFDVDAIGLVNIVHNLNRGLDLGGNPIGTGTGFVIGVGANPGLTDMDEEIRRFEYKVEAGAEYAVTQPVFDLRLLENFLKRIEHCRIPVVAGIWPLVSVRNAEFMKNELRVSVPDSILERMARAQTPEAARAEGVAIAREMLMAARQMVQGAQISAPQGRYSSAVDVLEALGTNAPAALPPKLSYCEGNSIRILRLQRCLPSDSRSFPTSGTLIHFPVLSSKKDWTLLANSLHYNRRDGAKSRCPSLKSAFSDWRKLFRNWKREKSL